MTNDSDSRVESPDEIVEHISRLMGEAEALLVGPVPDRTGQRLNELRARFESLQAKAATTYADARKRVTQGARATDEVIRDHPYESLAIALGVGVLLGALLRRGTR